MDDFPLAQSLPIARSQLCDCIFVKRVRKYLLSRP